VFVRSCSNLAIQLYNVAFKGVDSSKVLFMSWMISADFKPFKNKYIMTARISIFFYLKKKQK